ncbi:DUF4917 family protein [Providencia rettgeri]|uniref:DUF4917 family protein n=1 Tax=Providencia rettgeri TaxID=587 RepID=UPI003CC7C707
MWEEIESEFADGALLLGNGASMAVSGRFGYGSLIEHANNHGLMNDDVKRLFHFFDTKDFELVLRLVWQATNINEALQIADTKTRNAYLHVRECLIKSVRDIHPQYQEVSTHMSKISSFVKKFKTVVSLNYDLILYWAIMYDHKVHNSPNHRIKDCFVNLQFYEDWRLLRKPYGRTQNATLVFYPHGNLALCRDRVEAETKITVVNDNEDLLNAVLRSWETGEKVPLFVSEGTAKQKVNSIKSSNYLNTVYREVFTSLKSKLVIYGWDIGEHDLHILDRIKHSEIKMVAISVYDKNQSYCNRVEQIIKDKLGTDIIIKFFDSQSPNCWNN